MLPPPHFKYRACYAQPHYTVASKPETEECAANLNDNVARMIMAGWHLCLYGIKVIRGRIICALQLEYLYQLGDLGARANVKCGIKQNQPRLPFLRVSAPSHSNPAWSIERGEMRDHNIEIQNTGHWWDLTIEEGGAASRAWPDYANCRHFWKMFW